VILYIAIALICAAVPLSTSLSLALGIFIALAFGNSHSASIKPLTSKLLGIAIVGLGAGMNLSVIAQTGFHGLWVTVFGILATMVVGHFIGKFLRVPADCSTLISTGTAICGGSAIAAMAPAIKAKPEHVSVALITVFCLNAAALFLFPIWGRWLGLTQSQFGLWAALAIHDTSSVVGAASQYGDQALEIATTVKLARALWIAPLVIAIYAIRSRSEEGKFKFVMPPWFIFGFIAASAMVTLFPVLIPAAGYAVIAAKRLLVMTLFLIGCTLTREHLKKAGFRPFLQGFLLWALVTASTLSIILVKQE
jgi:uncharacterized integral membrane protein (TIGR00698 family)